MLMNTDVINKGRLPSVMPLTVRMGWCRQGNSDKIYGIALMAFFNHGIKDEAPVFDLFGATNVVPVILGSFTFYGARSTVETNLNLTHKREELTDMSEKWRELERLGKNILFLKNKGAFSYHNSFRIDEGYNCNIFRRFKDKLRGGYSEVPAVENQVRSRIMGWRDSFLSVDGKEITECDIIDVYYRCLSDLNYGKFSKQEITEQHRMYNGYNVYIDVNKIWNVDSDTIWDINGGKFDRSKLFNPVRSKRRRAIQLY